MVRSAALVKPYLQYINSKYLAYALRSPVIQNQIIEESRSTAQSNLFLGKIKNLKIILPPLNEQKRIVEKVEQLMGLCDELELKLRKEREDRGKLMEMVVRGLLEGAAVQE